MVDLTPSDVGRVIEVMRTYSDLPADFADASLVAVSERLATDEIVSFDRDFDIYRKMDGRPFVRLPG